MGAPSAIDSGEKKCVLVNQEKLDSFKLSCLKDVRANCFCASLLRTQMHTPRHAWARAPRNKMNNDKADGHCYAWI